MINSVAFAGRLTKDPEVRMTQNGIAVCSFTIANETGFGDSKRTNFIRCTAWRSHADYIGKFVHKGDMVFVNGQLLVGSYTDSDGNKREKYEVQVLDKQVVSQSKPASGGDGFMGIPDGIDDELPFAD